MHRRNLRRFGRKRNRACAATKKFTIPIETLPPRIKDLPQREHPRDRLAEHRGDAQTDARMIAILLRTGLLGQFAEDVGRTLIQRFGTLSELSRITLEELKEIRGGQRLGGGVGT